jgi:hypothetical protein
MAQITIYLEGEVVATVKASAKAAGVSRSQWIGDAIRRRVMTEWPMSIRSLAGAWPDFPAAEQLRERQAPDLPREGM